MIQTVSDHENRRKKDKTEDIESKNEEDDVSSNESVSRKKQSMRSVKNELFIFANTYAKDDNRSFSAFRSQCLQFRESLRK